MGKKKKKIVSYTTIFSLPQTDEQKLVHTADCISVADSKCPKSVSSRLTEADSSLLAATDLSLHTSHLHSMWRFTISYRHNHL